MGLGAKDQSRLAIAGSLRNYLKVGLCGDNFRGRDTDCMIGGEIPRHAVKLRMLEYRKCAE